MPSIRILLIPLLFALASCAQKVTSISSDVDKSLDENTGYLLIGINTNRYLQEILVTGTKSLKLTSDDLKRGTNYLLVDVPAGHYQIDRVRFNKFVRLELEDDEDFDWGFNVTPGSISYVGHLDIETFGFSWGYFSNLRSKLELENRSTDALKFMEENYPNILDSRWITYQGPGQDRFFDYIQTLKNKEVR